MNAKNLPVPALILALAIFSTSAAEPPPSSFAPVVAKEPFPETMARMAAAKPALAQKQRGLLEQRYDPRNDPAPGVAMSNGKPVQQGVRVRLKQGTTWEELASMTPGAVLENDGFPQGFLALPHPNHPEGGALSVVKSFPSITINPARSG